VSCCDIGSRRLGASTHGGSRPARLVAAANSNQGERRNGVHARDPKVLDESAQVGRREALPLAPSRCRVRRSSSVWTARTGGSPDLLFHHSTMTRCASLVALAILALAPACSSSSPHAGGGTTDGGSMTNDSASPDTGLKSDATPDSAPRDTGSTQEASSGSAPGSACTQNSQCLSGRCNSATYCCTNNQADNGSTCSVPTDCCNNGCTGGTCCSPVKAPCYADSDCCGAGSGACQGIGANGLGACGAMPGGICSANTDCTPFVCGTTCVPSGGGGCVETPNTCCQPGGGTCAQDSDCCEPSSGGTQCTGGVCCFSFGSACDNDAECCGVACGNGTCGG
jgi:hypothetical protein